MPEVQVTIPPVPGETAWLARAVVGSNNFYLLVGDTLEDLLPQSR